MSPLRIAVTVARSGKVLAVKDRDQGVVDRFAVSARSRALRVTSLPGTLATERTTG